MLGNDGWRPLIIMNQVDHHVIFLMDQQLFNQNSLVDFTWKTMTKDKFFLQDESEHIFR